MYRNEEFLLRQAAGLTVIVPVGHAAVDFPGMISVNETGAFLWQLLECEQTDQSLAAALAEEYQVTQEQALKDVGAFLEQLERVGALKGTV